MDESYIRSLRPKKKQRLVRYELLRSGFLSSMEIMILQIVASYSGGCYLTINELCKMTNMSRSWIEKTTARLSKTGLLHKKYRLYKRHVLWIAPEDCQIWWVQNIKDTNKPWNNDALSDVDNSDYDTAVIRT